jgi:lipopolysaccharide export system protein LptC
MERTMFKSPVRKLVKFFRKSRDGWKAKCQEAKTLNKRLATQVRAVEKSRAAWRRKAELAERELRDMRQAGESQKNTAAA